MRARTERISESKSAWLSEDSDVPRGTILRGGYMNARGLGKGLGALISIFDEDEPTMASRSDSKTKDVPQATRSTSPGTQELAIDLIDSNINQPRKDFNPEHLQELSDSIKANGIFQPILVTRTGERYMIIAGERRWRAAKMADLKTVPAIIKDYNQRQISEIAIVENLQREDLNAIELAQGIKRLMDEFFLTQEKVATALGKNRSSIANVLRLLTLPSQVQGLIRTGALSAGHAKILASVSSPDKCLRLANQSVNEGLSVRQLEELVKGGQDTKISFDRVPPAKQSLELRHLERELTHALGTKVSIQGNSKRGKIIVEYFDGKELVKISDKLKT